MRCIGTAALLKARVTKGPTWPPMGRWDRRWYLLLALGLTSLGDACSVASGWQRTSDANQAAAAQVVLQGVADGAFPCARLDPSSEFDAGKDLYHYRTKDEERAELS